MEEYQNLDDTELEDIPEDSPVLTEIRNQNRRLEKENAKLTAQHAEWELAAQTQRAEDVEAIMNALQLPGLKEDVLQWVGGDITQEAVIGALEARSIPLPEGTEVQPQPESIEPSASAVGQQVADAAAGRDGRDFDTRIAEAESQEEIVALMEEAGLSRSHS